jgi:hypothetical protein
VYCMLVPSLYSTSAGPPSWTVLGPGRVHDSDPHCQVTSCTVTTSLLLHRMQAWPELLVVFATGTGSAVTDFAGKE